MYFVAVCCCIYSPKAVFPLVRRLLCWSSLVPYCMLILCLDLCLIHVFSLLSDVSVWFLDAFLSLTPWMMGRTPTTKMAKQAKVSKRLLAFVLSSINIYTLLFWSLVWAGRCPRGTEELLMAVCTALTGPHKQTEYDSTSSYVMSVIHKSWLWTVRSRNSWFSCDLFLW